MRVRPGFLAAVIVLALTASAAGVQAPWAQPPVDLSAAGQFAGFPPVAVAPDGTATAVWVGQVVQTATRLPGRAFAAAVDLSAGGQPAFFPQVAVAPDCTATAVWERSDGANSIVQAATRPPRRAFAPAVDLSLARVHTEFPPADPRRSRWL